MTIRDMLSKESIDTEPHWLSTASETTKDLFKSAKQEFERLKFIHTSGIKIKLKDRKINQSIVARNAGKDKSILSTRRQPELMLWIQGKNQELLELQALPTRPYKKPKSKSILKSELSRFKEESTAENLKALRLFVESVFSSDLLSERDLLARDILHLKRKNEKLNEQIVKLQELCHDQAVQIAKLKNSKSKASLKLV